MTVCEINEIGRRQREVVPRSEAEALAEALESVVNVGDRAAVLTAEPVLLDFRSRHPKETP